mgnify:CR=1 FL=1
MKRIARFEKVSPEQAASSGLSADSYEELICPRRATAGSAGYDFFAPYELVLEPGEAVTVPTGFRVRMVPGWVLQIFPRSGLGFKFKLQLANTVGIIDSDYYHARNEGHIMIKLFNDGREGKSVRIAKGEAFAQGVFTEYGITFDDGADGIRTGGFGSTT